MSDPRDVSSYLGAARLVRVEGGALVVVLEEARADAPVVVRATQALAFPYRPRVGDQLLVVGDAMAFWVIGVLEGRGEASLSNPAGVSIRAVGGALAIRGDAGVRAHGGRVRLTADRLRQAAVRLVATLGERATHVRDTWRVEAGQVDELSQGRHVLQARRVVMKTLTSARIKSSTVRVG